MGKILRKTAQIFAGSAPAAPLGLGQFGSKAANAPTFSTDPAVIQALNKWLQGWSSALSGNLPDIEDMNGVFYVLSYFINYVLQEGIAEWDSGTTYFKGSFVQVAGVLYTSNTDNNLNNNPVTDATDWSLFIAGGSFYGLAQNGNPWNVTVTTLPSNFDPVAASLPIGTVLQMNPNGFAAINPAASNLKINGGTAYPIQNPDGSGFGPTFPQLQQISDFVWSGTGWILKNQLLMQIPGPQLLLSVAGTNTITATTAVPLQVYADTSDVIEGTTVYLIPVNNNTGALTLSVGGSTPRAIVDHSGVAFGSGTIFTNHLYALVSSVDSGGVTPAWRVITES